MRGLLLIFAVLTICVGVFAMEFREIPPAASLPGFPGAYYRKAASSFDAWTGIEGVIVLPDPSVDLRRWDLGGPLDGFSIYMGGRSNNQETDAGLTWEITRDEFGNIDRINRAWRPFWRVTEWNNAPAQAQYYWYPGDRVRMSVVVIGPGMKRLTIEDATENPEKSFTVDFPASQWGRGYPTQFKRVNAIDQRGNEGRPVQPTRARVVGAVWEEVWLYRGEIKVPFFPARFTDMREPGSQHFVIEMLNEIGGESIDIFGSPE